MRDPFRIWISQRAARQKRRRLTIFQSCDISKAWQQQRNFLTQANHYLTYEEARLLRANPLPPRTTVFAKIGAAIALNRRAILSEFSIVDNNVLGLHAMSAHLVAEFLFYFMWTIKLGDVARATTVPSVRKGDVENIPFPLPPLPEQHRIVAEIENQFSRLDASVAALNRAQVNLKRYRSSVLKAACEGKLVPTEAEMARDEGGDYEPADRLLARILVERRVQWASKPKRRGKYKEPAAPDTSALPELPVGWVWATIDQLAHIGTGSTPLTSNRHFYEGGTVPWVTSSALNSSEIRTPNRFVTSQAVAECRLSIYPPNTLLVAMYGEGKTRGKCAELFFRAATNQAIAAIVMEGSVTGWPALH